MKKRYLLILSSLVLAGCTGNSVPNSNNKTSSGGSSTTVVEDGDIKYDDNGNIIYDNVTIKMWSVTTGEDAKTQDQIISQFNELYSGMIKVETTHTSRYDLEQLITTTMEFDRKNAPELFFSHGSRASEYVSKDWLQPIEPYMNKAGLIIDKEDFTKSLLDSTTVNNDIYGLPQDVHSAMIVVRKDILEKNGLKIPTNYYELVEVSEKAAEMASKGQLQIRGENSFGTAADVWRTAKTTEPYYSFPIAYGDMWVHEFAGYTAAIQNGSTIADDKGNPTWNNDGAVQGLQVLRDWCMPNENSVNKTALSKIYGSDYDVGNAPFRQGDAIFKLLGPWEYQSNLTEFDRDLKNDGGSSNITTISMSNMFAKDSTKEYANKIKGEGHAFMLMSTVESMTKRCAAMVFADYMVNNSGVEWAKRGHLPALQSVQNSDEYTSDPAYEQYISKWGRCEDYVVIPPTPYYSYVDSYFKNAVQKSMAQSFSSKTIASILKTEYEDCIDYIDLYA